MSEQTGNLTVIKRGSLEDIAYEIYEAHKDCERYKLEALTAAELAFKRARAVGGLLAKARRILKENGCWMLWFDKNIKDQLQISYKTAERYMAIYSSPVTNDCNGMTKAYIALGLIPEKKEKREGTGTGDVNLIDEALKLAQKRSRSLLSFLSEVDPQQWPDERRKALKEELRPAMELYQSL